MGLEGRGGGGGKGPLGPYSLLAVGMESARESGVLLVQYERLQGAWVDKG